MRKAKKVKTKALTELPKRKRGRPRKDESVVTAPKKRGRPRKDESVVTAPKKRGRPRKDESVVAIPKKRGRPRKVKETKEDKLRKVAKLGKRKFKAAVEQMALDKINKKIHRKHNGVGNGESTHGEPVSIKTYSYEDQSEILASPTKPPVGITGIGKKKVVKDEMPVMPIESKIKKRLTERGYEWKENTFKIVEKTSTYWVVEFKDKKQGEITSYNNVVEAKALEELEKTRNGKAPKLSKIELNRYVKKLVSRGLHPKNIKVIENTPLYFRIEFNDGDNDSVVQCGHVKGWEL